MTLYESLMVVMEIGSKIDVQWGLFVTVHLAIFGALLYVDRPLHRTERAIAVVTYAGFAVINFTIMFDQMAMFQSALADVAKFADDPSYIGSELIRHVDAFVDDGTGHPILFMTIAHAAMLILVTVSLFRAGRWKHPRTSALFAFSRDLKQEVPAGAS